MEVFLNQLSLILEANSTIGKESEAISNLQKLQSSLKTELIIPFSNQFSPKIIENIFSKILSLAPLQSTDFQTALHKFLNHVVSLMKSFCPSTLLMILTNLSQTEEQMQQNSIMVVWISQLIPILQLNDLMTIQLCQNLIPFCPIIYLVDIADTFWELLREKSSEEESISLIEHLLDPELARQAAIFCQKYSNTLIQIIVEKATLKFISKFLMHLPKTVVFDTISLNARIGDAINLDNIEEQMYSFQVLPILLKRLSISQNSHELTALKPVWKGILRQLKNNDSNRSFFIDTLMHGENQGLVELNDILPFIDFENELSPLVHCAYLRLIFHQLNNEKIQENVFPFLKRIISYRIEEPFSLMVSLIDENYENLKEIDENQLSSIVRMIFCPLSKKKTILLLLIKFLIHHTENLILIDIKKLIDEILLYSTTDDILPYFIELLNISKTTLSFDQLDWFGEHTHSNFKLFPEIDATFVFDLLSYHLIDTNHISEAFSIILKSKKRDVIYSTARIAMNYLQNCIEIIGFNILDDIKKTEVPQSLNTSFENTSLNYITWFDSDILTNLFNDIQCDFESSEFGRFLSAIMDFISEGRSIADLAQGERALIMIYSRCLGSLLPVSSSNLLVCMMSDFKMELRNTPESIINVVKANEQKFFDLYLPHNHFDSILEAAVSIYGEKETFGKFPELVKHAITYSYRVAKLFSNTLEQPLPRLKTFLAFMGIEKHQQWFEECKANIPFNNWIFDFSNFANNCTNNEIENKEISNLLQQMQNNGEIDLDSLDENHKMVLGSLEGNNQNDDNENNDDSNMYDNEEFILTPLEIVSAVQVNDSEPGTMANLISFLWHSYNIKPICSLDEIESYVFKHLENSYLVLGFLTYSSINGHSNSDDENKFNIDVDRWAKSYEADSNDKLSLYAASLIIDAMKGQDKEQIEEWKPFINKTLELIGCYSFESLPTAFYRSNNVSHLIIRSVINVFSEEFRDIAPLQVAEVSNDQCQIISSVLQCINGRTTHEVYSDTISTLSSSFFTSPTFCYHILPSNYPHNSRILSFGDKLIEKQKSALIQSGFLSSLFTVLETEIYVSYDFFRLLLNFALNTNQYLRICKMMEEKCPNTPDHLRLYFNTEDFPDFYICKPPSFIRGLFRISLSKFTLNDNKQILQRAISLTGIKRIHPALCYVDSYKVGMRPWKNAFYTTKMAIGKVDLKTIMSSFTEIYTDPLNIFISFCNIPDSEIDAVHAWNSALEAKIDFAKTLTHISCEAHKTVTFAKDAINCLISRISLDDLTNIVITPKFIESAENLLNMTVTIRKVIEMAQKNKNEDTIQKFEKIIEYQKEKDEEEKVDVVLSNEKSELLQNYGDKAVIKRLLHQ